MSEPQVRNRLDRMLDTYPRLFAALLAFLESPTLHGEFTITRRGDDELLYEMSRRHKERAGRRGVDSAPIKVL